MWYHGEYVVIYTDAWIARHQERLREWEEAIGEHVVINWEGLNPCGRPRRPNDPRVPAAVMRKRNYYDLRKNFE